MKKRSVKRKKTSEADYWKNRSIKLLEEVVSLKEKLIKKKSKRKK